MIMTQEQYDSDRKQRVEIEDKHPCDRCRYEDEACEFCRYNDES